MKVYHVATVNEVCGIGDYARHLMHALAKYGVESIPVPIRWGEHKYMSRSEMHRLYEDIANALPPKSVVHLQLEFGFFCGAYGMELAFELMDEFFDRLHRADCRLVITLHSFNDSMSKNEIWKNKIVPRLKAAGVVGIVPNQHSRLEFIRRGFPPKCLKTLFFPCTEDGNAELVVHTPEASVEAKARLGLPADSFVMTTFGFIGAYKGIQTVASSLEWLPDRYVYLLAGQRHPQNPERTFDEMLRETKKEYWSIAPENKGRRLFVTGHVPSEELETVWAATDVVVCCYKNIHYTMSAAMSEALSSGKPIIGSIIPSFSELNEKAACLEMVAPDAPCELAFAVQKLAANPAARNRLVQNAYEYARTHTWDRFAREIAEIYKEMEARRPMPVMGT